MKILQWHRTGNARGLRSASALLAIAALATAATVVMPKRYSIFRTPSEIAIDGRLDEAAWRQAPSVGDFHFHWYEQGEKEQTVAKMLWDDQNLYVSYYCHDKHISGYVTEPNGPVYRDDCVEIFVSPNPEKVSNYYNFEMNVLGTLLSQVRTDWREGDIARIPKDVKIATSHSHLRKKDESPDDTHWTLEMAIPFVHFRRDAANTPPQDGDLWRLNLNRIGGKTNAQLSSWSPLPPEPKSFHQPEWFGVVEFKDKTP